MSIFNQRPDHFKVLEVEFSLDKVKEKVIDFLATTSPSFFWGAKYAKAIGWKTFIIEKNHTHTRGLAYSSGKIHLTLNDSTRWMDNSSAVSELGGKDDVTPTGVLAHELGHQFMWALQDQGGMELWREYEALKARTAITSYGMTNSIEDFAEAYRVFALNPKLLARLNPDRYSLILRMDEFMEDKTGFRHGLARPLGNIAFAKNRIQQMLTG